MRQAHARIAATERGVPPPKGAKIAVIADADDRSSVKVAHEELRIDARLPVRDCSGLGNR